MFKNFPKPVLIKSILAVIFIFSVIFMCVVIYKAFAIRNTIKSKKAALELYRYEGLDKLKEDKALLEKQLERLNDFYDEITQRLASQPKPKKPKEITDPLKFKEELYKVQNKLKDDGKTIIFDFPFWLGFEKFKNDIPSAAELPVRAEQLEIIRETADLILKSGIAVVNVVEFKDTKDVIVDGEVVYKEYPMRIGFVCGNENLVNFLYSMSVAEIPLKVEDVKLKASETKEPVKYELAVELIISAAVFDVK